MSVHVSVSVCVSVCMCVNVCVWGGQQVWVGECHSSQMLPWRSVNLFSERR